jgi:uncharacterized membrane protein
MNQRRPVIVSLAIVLAMVAISAYGWARLPDDAQVPIHWGLDGSPDGYAPKPIALLIGPGLGLLLTVLFAVLPSVEPRRTNLERSVKAYRAAWLSALVLVLLIHAAAVMTGLGIAVDIGRVVSAGAGVLFLAIGNWLPKTRSNFILGVRTPWTLTSERSWTVTHRLAGRGFVILGLVLIALAALGAPGPVLLAVLFGGLAGLVTVLVAVSYRVWRSDPDRTPLGRPKGVS